MKQQRAVSYLRVASVYTDQYTGDIYVYNSL